MTAEALCRDCCKRTAATARRCRHCGSPRLLRHPELDRLSIAHMDCDAFYASVEKRDNPNLRDKPLIVGGGERGVVSTCCYIARTCGVRSAMPMAQARKLCPDAIVIPPNMGKYREVSRQIRALLDELTPLIEPLSLDEAFLDLTGTAKLHGHTPAEVLCALSQRIEQEIGVTVSIGLSYNKYLAKVASDLNKPRGFSVIGEAEAKDFLAGQPVTLIWGVGKALQKTLAEDGITRISQLQAMSETDLMRRYGVMGQRLYAFARGIDHRRVTPERPVKSVSCETTFRKDLHAREDLEAALWSLCEELAARLKKQQLSGQTITLKLKSAQFKLKTRAERIDSPTQLASILFRVGRHLLSRELDGTAYRLIGIGVSDLARAEESDIPDLVDTERERARRTEAALDRIRDKFGNTIIGKGRALQPKQKN